MKENFNLKDLTQLLEVLGKLNESGVRVNKEINLVLLKVKQLISTEEEYDLANSAHSIDVHGKLVEETLLNMSGMKLENK